MAFVGVGANAGVGDKASVTAGGVVSGISSAGSGNGICFRGFSGFGIGGVVVGTAGVTGMSGTGGLGSRVGIGAGVAGTAGTSPTVFADGVSAGVVVEGVSVCGIAEGVPGLTAAPGTAGGAETTGLSDAAGFDVAEAAPGDVVDGVVVVAVPNGNGCEFEITFVFCGC